MNSYSIRFLAVLTFSLSLFLPRLTFAQFGGSTPDSATSASPKCGYADSTAVPDSLSIYSGALRLGDDGDPVRIVEFFDPGCPHCRTLHNKIFPAVAKKVPQDSVSMYMHPFPLGKRSIPLFKALYFAQDQKKYQDLLRVMFAFGRPSAPLMELMRYYGRAAKLPVDSLTKAVYSSSYQTTIKRSIALARDLNVKGTPTLFIDRRQVSRDSYTPKCLARLIKNELNESTNPS